MRIIAVNLRKSQKIGSRLIRFATGEEFSHIGIQLGDDKIYHSDSHGCRMTSIDDFVNGSTARTFYFKVSNEAFKEMQMRAIEKLGNKYDFLGVIGFGVLLLLKRLGIRVKVPLMNPRWLICSEYAEYILMGTLTTSTPCEIVTKWEKFSENKV